MDMDRHHRGFTLLELLVALTIAALLVTFGLPAFSASARHNCTVTSANTLLSVLTAARSEALKRDRPVTLCKSGDGASCATASLTGWDSGYLMYLDDDGDGRIDSGELLLQAEQPLSSCAAILAGSSSYTSALSYDPLGKASALGNFRVIARSDSSYERRVVVSPTGRPRVCNPALLPGAGGTACPRS